MPTECHAGPVAKALWFIENRPRGEFSLLDLAQACGVSQYHLSRAFGAATGYAIMRYARARRLTEAARSLAAGATDILELALDAGYGSHEAFTRAFRGQFGVTPESVRAQRHTDNIELVEVITMDQSLIVTLDPPRFETSRPMLIAGLGERYSFETNLAIPAQWQRFAPFIGNIQGQVGDVAYGVCCEADGAGAFTYIAGVEVSSFAGLPRELAQVRMPRQLYAVFSHDGHVSAMRGVAYTIWNQWLPESGYEIADAPEFERYDARFNPNTGTGIVEVWLPVKR